MGHGANLQNGHEDGRMCRRRYRNAPAPVLILSCTEIGPVNRSNSFRELACSRSLPRAVFSAAHHLNCYDGPCENVHGHKLAGARRVVACENAQPSSAWAFELRGGPLRKNPAPPPGGPLTQQGEGGALKKSPHPGTLPTNPISF